MSDAGPNWDKINAIAAIIAISMEIIGWALRKLWEHWQSYRLSRRKCMKIKFDDIPPGRIHDCLECPHCIFPKFDTRHLLAPLDKCWEGQSSLAAVFSQAWYWSKKHSKLVPVPQSWPAGIPTLITDVRTLVAFILCASPSPLPWLTFDLGYLNEPEFEVRIGTLPGHRYVHIRGEIQKATRMLNKTEVGHLVSGYPPWYREEFYTYDTRMAPLKFPIRSRSDLRRGGWVVAVGLMNTMLETQKPLPFCIFRNWEGIPDRLCGSYVRDAIVRCRDHVRNNIYPYFTGDSIVLETLDTLDYLIRFGTESGLPRSACFKRNMMHMTFADCDFVMKNFNEYSALKMNEVEIYRQNILLAMEAVVRGAIEIVRYFKDVGRRLVLPDDLGLDEEIFLVDCKSLRKPPFNKTIYRCRSYPH